jgi:hypothetical protein
MNIKYVLGILMLNLGAVTTRWTFCMGRKVYFRILPHHHWFKKSTKYLSAILTYSHTWPNAGPNVLCFSNLLFCWQYLAFPKCMFFHYCEFRNIFFGLGKVKMMDNLALLNKLKGSWYFIEMYKQGFFWKLFLR